LRASGPGVAPERVSELTAAVNREFAPYALTVSVPWMRPWTRAGFTVNSLIEDVARRDLEAPGDRLLALVDRNFGDFLWGLLMPEVLGAVEVTTHTHGYVVATSGSVNQVFEGPSASTVHEFYHLLGCAHSLSMSACYRIIAALKQHADPDADFLPDVAPDGSYLPTRDAVNGALRAAMAAADAKRQRKPR
jgi:hypothetical protein